MSKPPANRLDAVRLAAEGASLERSFPLAGFRRLAGSLVSPEGDCVARLSFREFGAGVAGCVLEVEATATLRCQRCLGAVGVPLRSEGRIAFVASDAASAALPADVETVDADPQAVDLHALVEDELLLSLPLVPRHEGDECRAPGGRPAGASEVDESRGARRPFAGLRDLLKH